MSDPTCEQRIYGELKNRLATIANLDYSNGDSELQPLAVDLHHTIVIQLSTGGPGDQFECKVVKGKYGLEIEEITYRFLDWFDGAALILNDKELEIALPFCEYFVEGIELEL